MSDNNYQGSSHKKRSIFSIGKTALFIVLLSITGMILFRYFTAGKSSKMPTLSEITRKPADYSNENAPKEVLVNYIPAEYQANIDEENALIILSHPNRYRREFDRLVYDFNLSLLRHVANRMDLSADIKNNLEGEYQRHHGYLKDMYFQDFIAMKDTTDNYQQLWYEQENANAVEVLNQVASKYTCPFINTVISSLLETKSSDLADARKFGASPCGVALQEGLLPVIKRLEARAAIADFGKAKGLLEEKVEATIAELATMEVRDKKGLNKTLKTKVLGMNVSSTDIEVSAISILKVGFKLDQQFDVSLDEKRRMVTVTLPEPQILSHEVYPKVDKLDVGWMRELQNEDFNRNFNLLRREFRNDAINSDIMAKAKQEAVDLMDLMFSPVISSFDKRYQLQVRFRQMNPVEIPAEESAVSEQGRN